MKTSQEFYTEMGADWLSDMKDSASTESELLYLTGIMQKDSRVLDLACGYGRLSIPLAERGYRVYGVDITPAFIDVAQKEAGKRNLHIEFKVGDMRKIPYNKESFDYVICMWNAFSELTLQADQVAAVWEVYRVLRTNGMAIIEMRNHRSSGLIEKNFVDGYEAMPTFNHTRGSIRNLMRIFGVNGYKVFIDNFGGRKRLILEMLKA